MMKHILTADPRKASRMYSMHVFNAALLMESTSHRSVLMDPGLILGRMYILPTVAKWGTASLRRRLVDFLPWKALHELRDISDVLHNTSTEIYEAKKQAFKDGDEAVSKQIGRGKDIISILSE